MSASRPGDEGAVGAALGPETFHTFWHGCPLPLLQWACLSSFIANGHRVVLHAYDDFPVPDGVERRSADRVVPRAEIFTFHNEQSGNAADISPFSDYFRFTLLRDHGGWWVDTDVISATSDMPTCSYAWARENPEVNPQAIGTSQIRFPAGDPIIEHLHAECSRLKESLKVREQVGPQLISRVLASYPTPAGHLGTTASFYPLRWIEVYKLWMPSYAEEIRLATSQALFVNCYASFFSYVGLESAGLPPPSSLLMTLYETHCPERITGPSLTEREVIARTRAWFESRPPWAINELREVGGVEALRRLGLS